MSSHKCLFFIVAGLCLHHVDAARATIWTNEFDNFTGTDASAVSTYTDTNGGNAQQFEQSPTFFNGVGTVPAGWLTQGTVSGSNKSAKFVNVSDGNSGRVRFGTYLPTSMDALGGIGVAWRMRVGTANPNRGPIQICLTKDGSAGVGNSETTSIYIALRNSNGANPNSIVDLIRNGGTSYSAAGSPHTISTLSLNSNLADQYHEWMASAIWRPSDNRVYWNLYLDGTRLFFSGTAGHPLGIDPDDGGPLPAQDFSFSVGLLEGFGGGTTNRPYIGLGELVSSNVWDFDFDYVNYRDDGIGYFVPEPASLLLLAVGGVLVVRRRR